MEKEYKESKYCCEIPFFGAKYPDATCIDGYLYDLDSYDVIDGVEGLTRGGDVPCPFCNTDDFIESDPFGKEDEFFEEIIGDSNPDDVTSEQIKEMQERSRAWYMDWIEAKRLQYK
ncbi:hypothetical protein [Bacteroides sp. 51]|uniref:hypothetical protein n=1 Tax=Bacteroides sp. 51 TaxID=2302938 RepID=UPI0013D5B779|nr:hypothetical protein [Bacteroides sp. 51]